MASSRVVLVTGAAGGIGAAITRALIGAGHIVAAVDRDAAGLARLGAASGYIHPLVADLAHEAACREVVAATVKRYGRLDAVVNNAGIGVSSLRPDGEKNLPRIEELTTEIWDNFFAINVRAPMLLVQAALPHMRKGGFGRVINNTTSFRTMLRVLPYGATKSALESMSAIWAAELKGDGITVNVLIPGGPTDTPFISDGAGWDRAKMLRPADHGAAGLLADLGGGRGLHRPAHHRGELGRASCRARRPPPRPAAPSAGRSLARTRCG